jgi:2-oxoglutarate ferredoxin oxidoreductase subunit beta
LSTQKDFASSQEVRWCPGCGDYSILKAVQKVMAEVGARQENTVIISGIGCSSRFPYYMSCYGFHGIHGRAPTIASGVLLANPDLDVWIVTGDGDGLAIGGNHMLHLLRRNFNCQVLLFNNEIYGLTKGQYSPTSRAGAISPSSPSGTLEAPVDPVRFALGCGARFVARAVDRQQQQLVEILKAAYLHKGTSFVEILQNCVVYNDGAFEQFTDKNVADDNQIKVVHGKPLAFGKDKERALRCSPEGFGLQETTAEKAITHDERNEVLAHVLAKMQMPLATGVLYNSPARPHEKAVHEDIEQARTKGAPGSIAEIMQQGFTWDVT